MSRIRRAERFPIVTRVLWRPRSQSDWAEGSSINVSRSGLLFRAGQCLEVGTEVELIFALSWEASHPLDTADVRCSGHIVRTEDRGTEGPAVVTTIEYYSLMKQPQT